MTIRVEWVGYGRPAAARLRAAIAAVKGEDPLREVTVVVPSNHVGVATRRLLASGELGPVSGHGTGIAAVTFLTLYRLAELLGAARMAAGGCRPVSTPVIAAAVRAALADRPGVFGPVAGHAATEGALVASYHDLRQATPEALDRVAARSPRAADVVRLHRAVRRRLAVEHFDEEDLVAAAIEALGDGTARVAGPVVVHLPQQLAPHGAALLGAVAEHTDVVVLAGTTGSPSADGAVGRLLGLLGGAPPPPSVADAAAVAVPGVAVGRTRLLTASDADEEVRAAVRAVVDSARAGTPLERVALLYGAADPYARIVHEQLAAADIPHNGAAVVPPAARAAGRALLGLLGLPATGFGREDLFAWLAGAPLRREGGALPVTAWERLSREAGVVAGRDDWDRLVARYARERATEAGVAAADPDAPVARADRLRREAGWAEELRDFVLAVVDDLGEAAARPRRWGEHAAWARRHLATLLGAERQRASWPAVEREAADRTERALDRLALLDRFEGPVGLDVFHRTLVLELSGDTGRVGRMGEGVMVGTVRMGVGLDLDLVIVLGLAEGSYPAPVRDDPLLPDHEREAAFGQLPLRSEETERRHHELLATLAGATRQLLCVPRGDLRRTDERVPSRWAVDVASALAGRRLTGEDVLEAEHPWIEHIASFDDGLRRVAFPATEQEHRLCALLAHRPPRGGLADAARADPVLAAGSETVAARRSPRFTRFDGNLAGLALPSPAEGVTSATRLEGWAACPFAYLLREVLHVEPVENPEDRLSISPLDYGSLVHSIFERFIDEVVARPPDAQPAPQDPWGEADRRRLQEIADDTCAEYEDHGLVGRPLFWQRDRRRLRRDLERFLREDSARRAERRTRPMAAELAFGMRGAHLGSVALALPGGRAVSFRGKADRLDVAADGGLEVVDYKTGRADAYARLTEDDPDAGGRRLQLAVYALAARQQAGRPDAPVRSEYWFTSGRGGFVRRGYQVTPAVLERVGSTVGRMVEAIEAGTFPPYPDAGRGPGSGCPYCDPDGLGVADLRRQLERKREDPAVAAFLALVEGTAGTADG